MPKKSNKRKNKRKQTRKHTRKQKIIAMIGCSKKGKKSCYRGGSGCGSCGCPLSPLSWNQMNKFGGGNPIPGPIVGNAWSINNLSGEKGIGGDANYLKQYNTNMDPSRQQLTADANAGYLTKNIMVGGYRYGKKHSISKKGGALIPQDLVNLGRDFSYNFKSAYNALNGYKAPVDPAPYKGQLVK